MKPSSLTFVTIQTSVHQPHIREMTPSSIIRRLATLIITTKISCIYMNKIDSCRITIERKTLF